jgi:hypothetical protein
MYTEDESGRGADGGRKTIASVPLNNNCGEISHYRRK